MRNKTSSQEDIPSGVTPNVPWRVRKVQALDSFRLHVKFVDDSEGIVDMSSLVQSENAGVFLMLRDPSVFKQVYLLYGAVSWPGDIDLAPDVMHEEISKNGIWTPE